MYPLHQFSLIVIITTVIITIILLLFSQTCSFWVPVTPVSKESCLKYVSGSHKWGKWFIPTKFATLENYRNTDSDMNTDKAFENTPDIDAEPENYQLLFWDLEV